LSPFPTGYHDMKTYGGSGAVFTHSWPGHWMEVSGQLHGRGKSPRYRLGRRLGESQSWCQRGGEEKKSLHCPYRESNSGRPARNVVTILTELPCTFFHILRQANTNCKLLCTGLYKLVVNLYSTVLVRIMRLHYFNVIRHNLKVWHYFYVFILSYEICGCVYDLRGVFNK
jgi:hypothetical protein